MEKIYLSRKLASKIRKVERTGMGWTCVRIILKNNKTFKNVVILNDNEVYKAYGFDEIPFKASDVKDIVVTHTRDYPKDFKGFE